MKAMPIVYTSKNGSQPKQFVQIQLRIMNDT